jgi:hypothetical protein
MRKWFSPSHTSHSYKSVKQLTEYLPQLVVQRTTTVVLDDDSHDIVESDGVFELSRGGGAENSATICTKYLGTSSQIWWTLGLDSGNDRQGIGRSPDGDDD